MGAKQKQWWSLKIWLLGLFAIVGISFSLHAVAFADYTPTNGGKCDDGSAPTTTTIPGSSTPKQTCADSTKKAGTATPTGTDQQKDSNTNAVHCAVEKIGWIVCPVMQQAAKISDKGFEMLADNFLSTDPELVSNQSGTKTAWDVARNIANIMFIIAFLVIIVSQTTGMGITNYGLKKMIPRLLVAAILVNVSYYICQLVVDLTNILGYEIEEAMVQISNNIGPSVFGQASQLGDANVQSGWGTAGELIVVGALAAAAVVWLIMGPMMAVVMLIIVTLITIIIILMLRKALIVLLIVASPIAFVLYLLPNTEKLFSKWKDMFIKILFIFPVIGLLFGAGQLASTIILTAGAESQQQADAAKGCNPDDIAAKKAFVQGATASRYDSCGMGSIILTGPKGGDVSSTCGSGGSTTLPVCKHLAASWPLALVALAVSVAPLIAVWSVLKGALSAAGSIGNKLNATLAKGQGSALKRAQATDQARQNRMALNGVNQRGGVTGAIYRRRATKNKDRKDVESLLNRASAEYVNGERLGGDIGNGAGGTMFSAANPKDRQRLLDAARAAEEHEKNEQQKGTMAQLRKMTGAENEAVALGGTVNGIGGAAAQEAAILKAASEQNIPLLEKAMERGITSGSRDMQHMIAEAIDKNYAGVKSKAAWMTDSGMLDGLRSGTATDTTRNDAIDTTLKGIAEETLASQKESTLGLMEGRRSALASGGTSNVGDSAAIIASLQRTSDSLSKNAVNFGKMTDTGKSQINRWK
jgi:hypothetical protein